MNLVYDALLSALGYPRRGASGWHSFNAVCCPHVGNHRPDRTKRGNIKQDGPTAIYYCHNCQFRTGWTEGKHLGGKMRDLLGWAGLSGEQIQKLNYAVGQLAYQQSQRGIRVNVPDGLQSVKDWIDQNCKDLRLLEIAEFLLDFDPPRDLHEAYWTPDGNGDALDTYIILVVGDLSWPTGWIGIPHLDQSQPHRNQHGIEPTDDDIPPETLAKMDRLMALEEQQEDTK